MPDAAPLEPGDPRALGQYEVVGRLGAGGQGAVYLGRAPDGGNVAIKLLHAQMAVDPAARARFTREVSAAQKVAPFCTARVIDADVHGDQPYIISEYINGPSLHDVVAHNGPRGAADLERLAIGTVTALAAIHDAGIVHRDFKPNNVLLADDGPRVVDFGIARTVNSQESAVTATGMVVGTPGYLAPEQLTGASLTPAVDIFAWAATMVFAATGQSPFEADTLPVIINRILHDDPDLSALPAQLREIVGQCLAKDPALRPPAHQMLLQLLGQVGAAPVGPAPAREELLGQGTQIAAQLPPPPPLAPGGNPPPQPITPPPVPMQHGAPGPMTPPPQPITPPPMPMQQGGYPPPQMQPPQMQPPHQPPMMMPAGGMPPPQMPPPRSSSSAGPLIAVFGCLGVLLLVVVVVVVAIAASKDDNEPEALPDITYTPPPSFSSPSSSSTRAPENFDGTWKGTGFQPNASGSKSWQVEFRLLGGYTTGRATYSTPCTAILIVQPGGTTARTTYKETIISGACVPVYVTFIVTSSTTMRFEERVSLSSTPTATGTLVKEPGS